MDTHYQLGLPFQQTPETASSAKPPDSDRHSPPPAGGPILYYAVADIQAAFSAITAKGAPVKEAPKAIARVGSREVWLGFTEDPDGHPVGLMSDVPLADA